MAEFSFPVGAIGTIVGWLKKHIQGKIEHKKERFEQMFQETFDSFLTIHRDYVGMFDGLRRALIEAKLKGENSKELIRNIHQEFSAKRGEYEGVRTQIRAMATELIKSSTDPIERRFLWALLCYFLEYDPPHKSPDKLDAQVDRIVREGYDSVFATPSSHVMTALSEENDLDKLIQLVSDKRKTISEYLSDVCNTFVSLKASVYA